MAFPIKQEIHAGDKKPIQKHVKLSNIGEQIRLYVNTTDYIRDVKAKIHDLAEIPIKSIDLLCNGDELWNGHSLSHYNITKDCLLYAIFPVEDVAYPITVCIGKEKRMAEIKVKPWYVVINLKDKIESMTRIPSDKQRIYSNGSEIKNDVKLQEFISSGHTLIMYYGIRLNIEYRYEAFPSGTILEMDESDTIADVRKIVQEEKEETRVHLASCLFCIDGKLLQESDILSDNIVGKSGRLSLCKVFVHTVVIGGKKKTLRSYSY